MPGIVQPALGHHALALAEQVGQRAHIADGDLVLAIGHDELDPRAVTLQAAGLHQPADAEGATTGGFALGHLGGRVEEDDVAVERVEQQACDQHQGRQARGDPGKALLAGRHELASSMQWRACRRRPASSTSSSTRARADSP